MCYNEPVSWITLTIGTLFTLLNIYKYHKNFDILIITVAWYAAVTMQFWEAMLYRSVNNKKKCIFFTKGAYFNNLLQPFILILLAFKQKDNIKKYLSFAVWISYFIYAYNYIKLGKNFCAINNNRIQYVWWDQPNLNGLVYLITIFSLFYLLINKKFKNFQLALLAITLSVSFFMNRKHIGSIWCWFASFVPLINYLYFSYYLKIKK